MNRRKTYKIIMLLFVVSLLTEVWGITVNAASATINFSTASTVVSKGNNITVSLTLDADENIGEFEGVISYDSEILEFIEASNFITGGEGNLRVSDTNATDVTTQKKYTMRFTAKKVGICEFVLSGKPIVYNYEEGKEMSVSSNRITIDVKSTKRASADTSLSDLKISPGVLSPKFDPKEYNYTASVSNDVNSLVISAKTKDAKASVKVTGNENLLDGENTVLLSVRAESGDTKDYTILVKRDPIDDKGTEDDSNIDNDISGEFNVSTDRDRTFVESGYRYEIINVDVDTNVPVGFVKTKLILYGVSITAYTKENDLDNEFLLIYAMNKDGDKNFYQYDRVEKTMQRYIGQTISTEANYVKSKDEMTMEEYNSKVTQLSLVIAVLSAMSALLAILVIKFYLKTKGYKDDYLD